MLLQSTQGKVPIDRTLQIVLCKLARSKYRSKCLRGPVSDSGAEKFAVSITKEKASFFTCSVTLEVARDFGTKGHPQIKLTK